MHRMANKVLIYVEYRAVSGVFQTIDPPTPLSTQRVCPPPAPKAGGAHYTLAGRWGGGGSVFWKTPDIGLASYSIISLRYGRMGRGEFERTSDRINQFPN
jgi:hypothetical protein